MRGGTSARRLASAPPSSHHLRVRGHMGSAPIGARVLVVEDEPGVAGILEDLLTDEGYQVTVSVDGQALAVVQADPPDLILLDLMMPGRGGLRSAGASGPTRARARSPSCSSPPSSGR